MAFVYQHIRLDNNEVFYIGIATKNTRPYTHSGRNKYWKNIVSKYGYKVEILHENISRDNAKKIEIELILKYGRKDLGLGNLVNMTDGGDGCNNVSYEVRKKHSDDMKGKNNPRFGKSFSHNDNSKNKMSQSRKGVKFSDNHKKSISKSLVGREFSEEHKENISKSRIGLKLSDSHIKVLSKNSQGSNNPKSKLNEDDVLFIRSNVELGFKKLSLMFGIHPTNIKRIIDRKTWKCI
jgi:hypothetical protein